MSLYGYIKAEPKRIPQRRVRTKAFLPFFSLSFLFGGFALIASVIWPVLFYQLNSAPFRRKIIAPIANEANLEGETAAGVVLGKDSRVDYTKASNWYPVLSALPPRPSKITHYTLSVPELKIEEATVQVGGEDLMESLIQYPGTALPGQYGNAVIFGHSVLPQFFNPKNYKTIFSTLPELEEGNEIFVNFDGIIYRYLVVKMVEADPDDLSVLEQHYDSQSLTLITCVPPGLYFKRLIVKAQLVQI